VEVDEALAPVTISRPLLHELRQHARETLPEECCGLIVGDVGERYQRLVRCRNEMTLLHRQQPQEFPRDGRSAFYMNPQDVLRVREEAEAGGEAVTAVYHSHVDMGAYLSELDLEYAEHGLFPFPEADQIVVSVVDGRVAEDGVAVFRRDGQGGSFRGRRLAPGAL
jgi:proteasome lid subunit RPN8/RPN11